jgi:alpha-N-arabinofuranosidase
MSRKARITLHPAYRIGAISPRLYGSFLEPIGTMVNGTMYNPKHPTADEHAGFIRRNRWIFLTHGLRRRFKPPVSISD